jgi:hypothetical protein
VEMGSIIAKFCEADCAHMFVICVFFFFCQRKWIFQDKSKGAFELRITSVVNRHGKVKDIYESRECSRFHVMLACGGRISGILNEEGGVDAQLSLFQILFLSQIPCWLFFKSSR